MQFDNITDLDIRPILVPVSPRRVVFGAKRVGYLRGARGSRAGQSDHTRAACATYRCAKPSRRGEFIPIRPHPHECEQSKNPTRSAVSRLLHGVAKCRESVSKCRENVVVGRFHVVLGRFCVALGRFLVAICADSRIDPFRHNPRREFDIRNTEQWIAIEKPRFRVAKTEKTPQKTVFERPQL